MSNFEKRILCIGAGYVGGPTMAMIAHKCPQYKVTVVDINHEKIAQWNSDRLPVYEPGLDEIVGAARGRNLFFETGVERCIREASIIFVAVNTPTKAYGAGAGMAADLQYWEKTARQIREAADSPKIVIEKCTIPVKTALAMEKILSAACGSVRFDVISNPEFLAEGTAIRDLEFPDRVLVGSRETGEGLRARREVVDIYANWVPKEPDHREQHLEQRAFKACRKRVSRAAHIFDKRRVGPLRENRCGRQGSGEGHRHGQPPRQQVPERKRGVRRLVLQEGHPQPRLSLQELRTERSGGLLGGRRQDKRIPERALRAHDAQRNVQHPRRQEDSPFRVRLQGRHGRHARHPALYIAKSLVEERAEVVVTDPKALENAMADLAGVQRVAYEIDPYKAARGCDAIAVMTEWKLYAELDYERIYASMAKPAFIFDGRNILDHKRLFEIGFNVFCIGKTPLAHA